MIIMAFRLPNFSVIYPEINAPIGNVIINTEVNHEISSALNAVADLSLSRICVEIAGYPRQHPDDKTDKLASNEKLT